MKKGKTVKRIVSVLLSVVLLFSVLAVEVFPVSAAEQPVQAEDYAGYTEISTKEGLNAIRNDLTGKYVLTADIEFVEADFAKGGIFYNDGQGWLPIGDFTNSFAGILDGNGHTISGLTFTVESQALFVGLFGYVAGGTIKNLDITDMSFYAQTTAGNVTAGGIAGFIDENSEISGCSVDGAIRIDGYRDVKAGGIVGNAAGRIRSCHNKASIYAVSQSGLVVAGGIVGELLGKQSSILYSYNAGHVEGEDRNGPIVGGIAGTTTGYVFEESDMIMTISKCYNIGTLTAVSSSLPYAGGIVGLPGTEMDITDCYNVGEVRVDTTQSLFAGKGGGIIGTIGYYDVTVKSCYNAGNIISVAEKPQETMGGIAGSIHKGTLTHCYYLEGTAKAGIGAVGTLGASQDGATVRCTINEMMMRNTFEGFDFDGVWMMGSLESNGFPILVSERNIEASKNGLVLYSDYPSLCIPRGDVATFYIRVLKEGVVTDENDGVAFAAENAHILNVTESGKEDGIYFVRFQGISPGMTLITFSDSNTGNTLTVPVNVYERTLMFYTIESVPSIPLDMIFGDKTVCNIYNYDKMYVENYQYEIDEENRVANLSFDVYNNSYIYGTVESYYENGVLYDACLIDKTQNLNTSLFDLYIKGSACLVSDITSGNLLSYKQSAAGASTCTHIDIAVPKNGYVRICNDAVASDLVNFINVVDIALSGIEIAGDIGSYGKVSADFSKDLLKEFKSIKKEAIKGQVNLKEFFNVSTWNLNFASSTLTKDNVWSRLVSMFKTIFNSNKLNDIVVKLCGQYQIDVGEDIFVAFSGAAGVAMESLFVFAKTENYVAQVHDYLDFQNSGCPMIQYNGGEYVSCDRVWAKSENGFGKDIALSVFTISLNDDILSKISSNNPDVYDAIMAGKSYTYNISLVRSQEEVQPDGPVSVFIPIPEELKDYVEKDAAKVFRVEQDGSLTDMDAWAEDGMLTFITNHFSLYIVAGMEKMLDTEETTGDGNDAGLPDTSKPQATEDASSNEPNPLTVTIIVIVVAAIVAGVAVFTVLTKRKQKRA